MLVSCLPALSLSAHLLAADLQMHATAQTSESAASSVHAHPHTQHSPPPLMLPSFLSSSFSLPLSPPQRQQMMPTVMRAGPTFFAGPQQLISNSSMRAAPAQFMQSAVTQPAGAQFMPVTAAPAPTLIASQAMPAPGSAYAGAGARYITK